VCREANAHAGKEAKDEITWRLVGGEAIISSIKKIDSL
jgi:hypothetical protein